MYCMMNEVYDSILISTVALGVSMLSRRALVELLGTPENLKGTLKLAVFCQWLWSTCRIRIISPIAPFKGLACVGQGKCYKEWANKPLDCDDYGEI